MQKNKSIKVNSILSMIRMLMSVVFPLISYPYACRVLLVDNLGKVNYSTSVVSYFVFFAGLGIYTYAIREGARLKDDAERFGKFATEMLIINMCSCAISYLAFFAVLCIPSFSEYRMLLLVSSLSILFNSIGLEWLFCVFEEYAYITVRSVAFQLISVVCLFLFVKKPEDYILYAFITVMATGGSSIYNLFHSRKLVKFFGYKGYRLKKHFKPIFIFFGMSASASIYLHSDTTMLGIMKGTIAVGYYSVAIKLNMILRKVLSSIGTVLLPRLSYYIELDNRKEFSRLVKKSIHVLLLLSVPMCIGLILLAEPVILLISGEGYEGAYLTEKIMAVDLILATFNDIIANQILVPLKKEKWTLIALSITCVENIAINAMFIPRYAQNGAAIATVLSELTIMVICYFVSRKEIDYRGVLSKAYQYFVAAVIMAVSVVIVKGFIGTTIIAVAIEVLLGACVYFLVLWTMKNEVLISEGTKLVGKLSGKINRL